MYFSSIHKDVQRRGVYMEEQTKIFCVKTKGGAGSFAEGGGGKN